MLSRATVRLLAQMFRDNFTNCHAFGIHEDDVNLAKCLAGVGIFPEKTRDEDGKQRFHDMHPNDIFDNEAVGSSVSKGLL